MRMVSTIALAAMLAIGGAGSPALAKDPPAPKTAPPKLTPAVQTALAAAQTALKANDTATAAAKIAAAKPAIVSDDDKYLTGSLEYQLYQQTKDVTQLSEAIDLMIASGKGSADQQQQVYYIQGQLAYNAKDYRKAETALTGARKAGSTNPDLIPLLAQSMNENGETLDAINLINQEATTRAAAGQAVPADWYQRAINWGYSRKATPAPATIAATTQVARSWVTAYPTKSNWHDALTIYRDQNKPDTDVQIDLLRLQRATNGLLGQGEYLEYAEDVYLRYPQEAATVLQEGAAKGVVSLTDKNVAEIMAAVKAKIPADKASLPVSEKTAQSAANGRVALNTADAYLGYADYPKAIALYRQAISKGGIDASTANLRMAMAQAISGDTASAKATFALVTGPRKALADYWLVHLDHPTVG